MIVLTILVIQNLLLFLCVFHIFFSLFKVAGLRSGQDRPEMRTGE